jgi:uncharacterized protein (TIGR03083 family)
VVVAVPADPPIDFAPLFRLERSRLLGLLAGLSPEEWQLATPCPEWTVLGLTGHLVGDDLSLISWQRDHHHGTPAPAGLDEAGFIDWLDDLQREWVHAARRISAALMVQLLAFLDDPVAATIAGQDPRARTAQVSWAGDEPQPAWLDHGRELSERWIHRQQLHEALGRPSDLRADLAEPVLDTLRWAYPYRLGQVDRPPGTALSIEVEGDGLRRGWCLVRTERGWMFDDDRVDHRLDATVTMSTEQAWRLLTNNYRVDVHRPIDVDGDPALTAVVLSTRGIIGHPE